MIKSEDSRRWEHVLVKILRPSRKQFINMPYPVSLQKPSQRNVRKVKRLDVNMAELKMCGICCNSICDRYIMRVADTSYHERCLLCSVCGVRLAHTCFTRDSKLYCRLDYDRIFAKKCLGCSERISADELVMRALDSVFHLRCFICVVCGVRLQRGDQFVIKQGQLFCRPDYEKEVEMLQGYGQGDFACDDILHSSRSQDGRRGPKRPRTILTTQQRRAFKASFEISPKPCRKVREALAKDTGLSVRIVQGPKRQHTMLTTQQREAFKEYFRLCPKPGCKMREGIARETGLSARIVQVWFQNQRAKVKKIQKKARQDGKNKDGDIGDDKKPKLKEEDSSPNTTSYLNDDSDTDASTLPTSENYLNSGNAPLTPDDQHSYIPIKEELMDSQDSSFFKLGNNNDHHHVQAHAREFLSDSEKLEPGFIGFPYSGSLEVSGGHQIYLQGPPIGLNPIDRLYSMQNSYFCGEDAALDQ